MATRRSIESLPASHRELTEALHDFFQAARRARGRAAREPSAGVLALGPYHLLVSRVEDPTDRRAVVISLTAKGRAALAKKESEYAERRGRIADALEPHEQKVAAELLRRLAAVIEEL